MIITRTGIDDIKDLKAIACKISGDVGVGSVICLTGDLGVGKTAFTRFLISAICGYDVDVNSPTFNLLQIYDGKDFQIYHYDLYRIKDENEIINLDLDYAVANALTVIEWPEIAMDFINNNSNKNNIIKLNISFEKGHRFISAS